MMATKPWPSHLALKASSRRAPLCLSATRRPSSEERATGTLMAGKRSLHEARASPNVMAWRLTTKNTLQPTINEHAMTE